MTPWPRPKMRPDDPTPLLPEEEAARLLMQQLDPIALPPCQREALLRRILQRTGGGPPLAPVPPPKAD